MAYPVRFFTGTYAEYKALTELPVNALYFCQDKKVIFQGDQVIPVPYVVIENGELPTEDLIDGLLYLDNLNSKIYKSNGTSLIPIFGENTLSLDSFNEMLEQITFDEAKRIITLPQVNGELLTINLGQDLVLNNAYYQNKEIILEFKTIDTTDEEITLIKIPVDDLIDIYTGINTDSISVEITKATDIGTVDEREVKATLKLHSAATNEKTNAIKVFSDGIYVDVESYADARETSIRNFIGTITGFNTVADAITDAKKTANKGVTDAAAAKAAADGKVPLARKITSTGKTLQNDLTLSYQDIDGAAPIDSPNFSGVPTTPTIAQSINWTQGNNGNFIASIEYVQKAITNSNTWGSIKLRKTWGDMK